MYFAILLERISELEDYVLQQQQIVKKTEQDMAYFRRELMNREEASSSRNLAMQFAFTSTGPIELGDLTHKDLLGIGLSPFNRNGIHITPEIAI